MPTFEFTVALDRAPADDDFDRLFDAGLDDTTPETRDGRGVLSVARDAASMSAAIVSVVRDVTQAGFRVVGVEDDDLVSLKTVAQRTGRSYESVRLLATGKRGPGQFPEPLSGDGWALYSWALVAEWYSSNYGAEAVPLVSPDQRVIAAAALMLRAAETAGPAAVSLIDLLAPALPAEPQPASSVANRDAAERLSALEHPVFGPLFQGFPSDAVALAVSRSAASALASASGVSAALGTARSAGGPGVLTTHRDGGEVSVVRGNSGGDVSMHGRDGQVQSKGTTGTERTVKKHDVGTRTPPG